MYFTSASIWWYFREHLVGHVKALIIVLCYALQYCVAFVCNSMMLVIFSVTFLYVRVVLMEYRTNQKTNIAYELLES
jgi:hypothetical protein